MTSPPQHNDWEVTSPPQRSSPLISPQQSSSPAPPLPPRIYANIPSDNEDDIEETLVKKPLPPLPTNPTPRLSSSKASTMPAETSGSFAQAAVAHVRQDSNPFQRTASFRCYDCDPRETGGGSTTSTCVHHSPRKSAKASSTSSSSAQNRPRTKGHRTKQQLVQPCEQKLSVTLPTGMHPYFDNMAKLHGSKDQQKPADGNGSKEHEPFDWLTGSVANFTFNSSHDKNGVSASSNNFNTQTDKTSRWGNKNIAEITSPRHSAESYQQSLDSSGGARAKTTSPPMRDLYGQVSVYCI